LNESSNSRIGKETEFETLQLEGEIAKDVIKNIKNAKNYFSDFRYKEIRTIIFDDFNHVVALFNCSNFPQSSLMMA
jgi:hypothetical protein